MAKQVDVAIDGNHVPNVLDVKYGLDCAKDSNGAPVDAKPRLASIIIVRRSDETTDYWDWALRPYEEDFKSGVITFYDPRKSETVMKTVEWTNGFLKSYSEVVPNIDDDRSAPQIETLEISASTIVINGVEWQAGKTWL